MDPKVILNVAMKQGVVDENEAREMGLQATSPRSSLRPGFTTKGRRPRSGSAVSVWTSSVTNILEARR